MSPVTIALMQTAAIFFAAGLFMLWIHFWLDVLPPVVAEMVAFAHVFLIIFASFYFAGGPS